MAGRSDETVARALGAVLRDQGWDVAMSSRRLRGSLNDVLGAEADEHRAAVDAVVLAVEEGIVGDLREVGREGIDDALPALTQRLAEWGLAEAPATWAIRTWAGHLPATTVPPPATRPPAPEPTTLPPGATTPEATMPPGAVVTTAPPTPHAPPSGATVLPSSPPRPTRRRPSGRVMAVAGTVLVLMAGGVAAAVAMNRVDTDPPTGQSDGTVPDGAASAAPAAADPGSVLAAPDTQVPAVENRLAMAGRTGGVQISRLGEVDSVGSGDAERSAPEGGRLIAFRLGRWPCGSGSCRTWDELALQVDVDGERRPLPTSGDVDTFVVAVPGDAEDVDLVLRSDGLTQSLSLVDQRPGRDNIAVLARSGRVDRVGAHFTLTERTSTAFDYGDVVTDTVPRAVRVSNAELMWFAGKARPSSPERAFLKVRVDYTIPYGAGAGDRYAFELREMSFVGAGGTTYRARDLDDGPGIDAVFEVPAGLKAGRLVLGGGSYVAQSEDGPFTRTLAERTVRLRFG